MKTLSVPFCILIFFLLASCQKELHFPPHDSAGSLKSDSAHDCYPSTVKGSYKVDAVLNNNNYIDVEVNVTLDGPYIIQSDTTNGYSFFALGNFESTGLQTVRLYGTGMPLEAGLDQFIIRYDTSVCIVDINIVPSSSFDITNCGGIVVAGTYQQSQTMDATNTATITVDVTMIGSYNITAYKNGITFYAAGNFTTIGPRTIVLTASGIASIAGVFDYVLTGASSNCSFPVTFYPPSAQQAEYEVGGASAACSQTVVTGIYMPGVPMDATNTVTVQIHVTTTGTYSMNTGVLNGVEFSASGTFVTTGYTTLTLVASGTPIDAGIFEYPISTTTSICGQLIEFGTNYLTASFNSGSGYTIFNNNLSATLNVSGGVSDLIIYGETLSGPNKRMIMELRSNAPIDAYTYTVNQAASNIFVTGTYTDPGGINWIAVSDINTTQVSPFNIRITSITTGPGGRVKGYWGGRIYENVAGPTYLEPVIGGFSIPLQ